MSARRFADQQPASFDLTPENRARLERIIAKYPQGRQASAVISALWVAQKQNNYWLPRAAIEKVAEALGMVPIRVLEVATFYTMFNLEPVGKYFIQMCGTTPCMLAGSDDIKAVLRRRIGEQRHITADGLFSWLEVECLGACCNAPMVQINDDYYEDLTPENFEKLLDDLAAGRPVKIGSQIGRVSSEPAGGRDALKALRSLYGPDAPASPENAEPSAAVPPAKTSTPADKPPTMEAPIDGSGDNLQLIRGIGPKLEALLHRLGFFYFSQIAAWTERQLNWVDENLDGFYGRAKRDEWVAQAKELSKQPRSNPNVGDAPAAKS